MAIFKSTRYILENPWAADISADPVAPPPKTIWNYQKELTIDDVELWEQIYYQPGNIGIYAAYEPYAEFYLLTYNLFMHEPCGIQTFYGKDAEKQLWQKIKELKILVVLNKVWADSTEESELPPL